MLKIITFTTLSVLNFFCVHYQTSICLFLWDTMPQSHRKSLLKRRLTEPQTASIFRGALESYTVTSQKPQRMYISRGINSPGFILLWLNSEKPVDRQMVAWKTRTFKKIPCKHTFCSGYWLSFKASSAHSKWFFFHDGGEATFTSLMLFHVHWIWWEMCPLSLKLVQLKNEVTSFWDSTCGTSVDGLICLLWSDKIHFELQLYSGSLLWSYTQYIPLWHCSALLLKHLLGLVRPWPLMF